MNKKEKEIAALYLSACMFETRSAEMSGNVEAREKAIADYKKYGGRIKKILDEKFELFGLDSYEKEVIKPIQEIYKITTVFYSQRVNGQQLKYPA